MAAWSICWILSEYTPFGRYVKVIGAGERAATVSGVAIDKYKTLAFVLCAALAGLSGVLLSARMAGGSARMADGFQMRAIAVVILGGTAISGGVGGPLRTFIGVLIVMVLDTGMNMVGVNPWFQQAIYGAILILRGRPDHRPEPDVDHQVRRSNRCRTSIAERSTVAVVRPA